MKEWEGKKCSVCDWNPVIWVDTCETCGNFDSVQFGCGFGVRGGSACQIRLSLRGSLDCFSFAVVEIYQCQSCFRGSSAGWWNQTAEQTLSTYSLQTCYVQMYVDAFCETFFFLSLSLSLLAFYFNASLQVLCVQISPFAVSGSFHVHGPSPDQSFQYPCRNCGKRYRLRTAMFRHRKKCEGNYDLVCCLCEQRFYRRDRYNEHFLRVHRVSPP